MLIADLETDHLLEFPKVMLDTTKAETIGELLAGAQARLAPYSDTPRQDAEVLMAKVIGRRRWWVLAHSNDLLGQPKRGRYEAALARLATGEPLPYVLGEWEFYKLRLRVSPAVLIPRPETELLVDEALVWLRTNPARRKAADVGTGSGCIVVALAHNVGDLQIEAGDISPDALEIAQQNVDRYRLQERVHLHESDLFSNLPGPFDLICANLPYIPEERKAELAVSNHEPHVALFAGKDGFALIRKLFEQSVAGALAQGGLLLAELDISQENLAPDFARSLWPKAKIEVHKDLAGLPRLLRVENSE